MTAPAPPPRSRRVVRLGLLSLLLLAVLFAIQRLRKLSEARAPASSPITTATSDTPAVAKSAAPPAPHASATLTSGQNPPTRRDRAARDELRQRIYQGFGRPPPPSGAAAAARAGALGTDAGTLDAAYIQKRIREDFVPLAKECYEAALERDGALRGRLVFSFVIVGDEGVGGIVESAELDPASTLADKELVYCLRESLLSLSFEPPEAGGMVTVVYPFVFDPSGGDE